MHDRLHAALDALGDDDCETVRGDTAMAAARKALTLLQWGLVKAMENNTDVVEGIIPSDDDSSKP